MLSDARYRELLQTRAARPHCVREAASVRRRRPLLRGDGTLFLIAADHPGRGALGVAGDRMAMADRRGLLDRLLVALANPEVDGVLATPDIVEDLLLLDALHDKIVIGSMNRGGLAGAVFSLDDRFTAYDPRSIDRHHLDGGKMLLRVDDGDAGTLQTLQACAAAVTALAAMELPAIIEPLPYRAGDGRLSSFDGDPDALVRAVTIASALGATSAYTWLKVPAGDGVERVAAASTLPMLLLGGDTNDPDAMHDAWLRGLAQPSVRGLVVGRALLYPEKPGPVDEVVGAAVADAAALLPRARSLAGATPEVIS